MALTRARPATRDRTWLVAAAAALWGTDALLRSPLAGALPAASIVFWEHLIIVVVLVPWLPRAWRAWSGLDARAREQWARERFLADQRARQERERLRPALAATPGDPFEAEPIFRSVAHSVSEERHYENGRYRHAPHAAPERHGYIPEPHPGSGPFPAQGGGRRRLAPVEEVPPPPAQHDLGPVASAEDELRRRAERRRRPRVEPESGRHVLRH